MEIEETLKPTATIPSQVAIPLEEADHLEPSGKGQGILKLEVCQLLKWR